MKRKIAAVVSGVLLAAGAASATPILQFDVNQFHFQARNGAGAASPFGGLSHTGSVQFSYTANVTVLNGVFVQSVASGPFVNQNFSGSLANFTGQITLSNGQVTGGNIAISINGGTDTFTTNIQGGVGQVSTFVGGGYKIEGLTAGGLFSDAAFGNVNVTPWFNAQTPSGLLGSFLQFNFDPNSDGSGNADMDLFVDVVPIPPALYTGMATLGGAMIARRLRRR